MTLHRVSHERFQFLPGTPVEGERPLQFPSRQPDPRLQDAEPVDLLDLPCLHVRSVIGDHGDWFAACTCSWLSTARLTLEEAHALECPIEAELLASRERERRLYARLGAG